MGDYFFIASELGQDLVMDIEGENTTPGTRVISYPKKSSGTDNQLWKKKHVGDTTFYLVSKLGPKITIRVINLAHAGARF